jgi:hypothetical protein
MNFFEKSFERSRFYGSEFRFAMFFPELPPI